VCKACHYAIIDLLDAACCLLPLFAPPLLRHADATLRYHLRRFADIFTALLMPLLPLFF